MQQVYSTKTKHISINIDMYISMPDPSKVVMIEIETISILESIPAHCYVYLAFRSYIFKMCALFKARWMLIYSQ